MIAQPSKFDTLSKNNWTEYGWYIAHRRSASRTGENLQALLQLNIQSGTDVGNGLGFIVDGLSALLIRVLLQVFVRLASKRVFTRITESSSGTNIGV